VLEIASLFHYKSSGSALTGVALPTLFSDRFRHVSTSHCTGFVRRRLLVPAAHNDQPVLRKFCPPHEVEGRAEILRGGAPEVRLRACIMAEPTIIPSSSRGIGPMMLSMACIDVSTAPDFIVGTPPGRTHQK